jgi:hypothetical protein
MENAAKDLGKKVVEPGAVSPGCRMRIEKGFLYGSLYSPSSEFETMKAIRTWIEPAVRFVNPPADILKMLRKFLKGLR